MHKLIKSRKGRKELDLLIITSVLILILLTISPATAAASISNLQSSSPEIGLIPAQIFAGSFIEVGGFGVTFNSIENADLLNEIRQSIDILYMLGGMWAAILIFLIYSRIIKGENEFKTKLRKALSSLKIGKIAGTEKTVQEEVVPKEAVQAEVVQAEVVQGEVIQERTVHKEPIQEKAIQEMSVRGRPAQEEDIKEVVVQERTVQQKAVPKELSKK